MIEPLDLSGEGPASDFEVESASEDIFDIIAMFDSPKDAGLAFVLAYIKFIKAAFPPEYKKEAFEAIDTDAQCVKDAISEGWQ